MGSPHSCTVYIGIYNGPHCNVIKTANVVFNHYLLFIDGAAEEKVRLEEKQRAARKDRKKRKEEWVPRYVSKIVYVILVTVFCNI